MNPDDPNFKKLLEATANSSESRAEEERAAIAFDLSTLRVRRGTIWLISLEYSGLNTEKTVGASPEDLVEKHRSTLFSCIVTSRLDLEQNRKIRMIISGVWRSILGYRLLEKSKSKCAFPLQDTLNDFFGHPGLSAYRWQSLYLYFQRAYQTPFYSLTTSLNTNKLSNLSSDLSRLRSDGNSNQQPSPNASARKHTSTIR